MIHLLAHDPDFTKPQEYDQLKDIKESVLALLLWSLYQTEQSTCLRCVSVPVQVPLVHAGSADDQE